MGAKVVSSGEGADLCVGGVAFACEFEHREKGRVGRWFAHGRLRSLPSASWSRDREQREMGL